ncbi:MAG TPA: hypothetical protein VJ947_04810, partial [Pseudohaliea sp.]|nr:hypothetical protein [Pseudohaliea sp.]
MGFSADIWLWLLGGFVALVLAIAKFRGKVRDFVSELHWWGTLATEPKQALRDLGPGGNPASRNDLDDVKAEILAGLRQLRAEKQAQGETRPLDADEETRTEEAVREVLTDPSLSARAAADAMREGRVQEAFRILRRDAEAGAAETAERWRRLGALARGIDTRQALEAYKAAFRLQPSHFWTCIELSRLRAQSGSLAGAMEAALAAEKAARADRDIAGAELELGNLEVARGNL